MSRHVAFPWTVSAALVGALLSPASPVALAQEVAHDKYQIRLQSREFTPTPGLSLEATGQGQTSASGGSSHFLVQLEEIPSAQEKERLAQQGIALLDYLNGNAFVASAKPEAMATMSAGVGVAGVRWAGPLTVEDKLTAELKAGALGKWAVTEDQRVVLTVQFHRDVKIADAEALVRDLHGEIVASLETIPAVTAIFPLDLAQSIAGEDAVQFVGVVSPPLGPTNDGARTAANVTPLAGVPYTLKGKGVDVLVYDVGRIDSDHPDFGPRVIQTDASSIQNHATHVGGTLGGTGINSNGVNSLGAPNGGTPFKWKGMAPSVAFHSFGLSGSTDVLYDSGGDLLGDFTSAINDGIDLANMSLANNVVRNGFPCSQLGDYTNTAILLDNIVRGSIAGQKLVYFVAAGNERQLGAPCGQYRTMGSPATAKNTIAVGAINSNNNTVAWFSSFGPTDDGRLKPDLAAPGCQVKGDGGIKSTSATIGDGYYVDCGTSMASPVAAGAASLLVEQWRRTRGAASRPLSHTVKAVFIHTATDRGNKGPDYQFGWGTLNARKAVDLVRSDDSYEVIRVASVGNGEMKSFYFKSPGTAGVKVTLAWDDPPATRLAATTLINNLDLVLVDPLGVTYRPLVLNPASPASLATVGVDKTNNVEMVLAKARAGLWKIRVLGTSVPLGPQQFTVIGPGPRRGLVPPVAVSAAAKPQGAAPRSDAHVGIDNPARGWSMAALFRSLFRTPLTF